MPRTSHALVSPLVLTLAVTYAGLLGGAERTLLDFTRGLPGGLVLACPEGALADRARGEGVQVVPLRARPLELRGGMAERLSRPDASWPRTAGDVRRLVREMRPDLLLAWGMRTAIAAPAAAVAIDQRPALVARHVDFLPSPGIARLMRAAVARADRVSVNSQAVARDLDPDGSLGGRLAVISPGIDLARVRRATGRWRPIPRCCCSARLMPWKRPDLALEAVARAAESVPDLRLTIAGAPMNAEGERLLAELRRRAERPDLDGRVDVRRPARRPAPGARARLVPAALRRPRAVRQRRAPGARQRPAGRGAGGRRARPRSWTRPAGACTRPATPAPPRRRWWTCCPRPELVERLGAGGRARAGWFEADEARQRFAELALAAVAERAPATERRPRGDPGRPHAAHHGAGMALVTVTHNSAAAVDRLLRSVDLHLPGARVIVVDSGSTDGSATAARAAAPRATVLELGENVGFGRASNAGVAAVEEPICVLINPDAELVDGSLADLAADLLRPGVPERILAPLVLSPDGSRQETGHLDPDSPLLLGQGAAAGGGAARSAAQPGRALALAARPAGRLGGGRVPGRADRDAAAARAVRRAHLPVRRGPRPGAARRRRGRGDRVPPRSARGPRSTPTRPSRRSAASRSSCSPASAAP